MPSLYAIPATAEHARFLAPRLRPEDRRECLAASGIPPEQSLPAAIPEALEAHTMVTAEGTPVAIFGVHPLAGFDHVGAVWLLATPEVERHSMTFLRGSREWVARMLCVRPTLVNLVDARNTLHIRWLRWCGFTFLATHERYGAGQVPFIEFAKVKAT